MKHLATIFLSIGVILSTIAIILPQWYVNTKKSDKNTFTESQGLWKFCMTVDDEKKSETCCTSLSDDNLPTDLMVSRVLSIIGTVCIAISVVLCVMMKSKFSKLAAAVGVGCLVAVLFVYPIRTLTTGTGRGGLGGTWGTNTGASYWLELAAAILGILGIFIK
jgi:hypothetical protein